MLDLHTQKESSLSYRVEIGRSMDYFCCINSLNYEFKKWAIVES